MATYHEDGFYWGRSQFTFDSEEQRTNALYVTGYLRGKGWTDNAIAGLLGNLQSESSINPGAYYGWTDFSAVSFGIVQWDPTSKYQNWHDSTFPGVMYEHLGCQLDRIIWEKDNGEQYYSTNEFPISFSAFATSTDDPGYLAKVFVRNYERPASVIYGTDAEKQATYSQRAKQAAHWYAVITGSPAPDPDPDPTPGGTGKGLSMLDLIIYTQRRRYRVV